ncbi:MAG: alkaline phosphatase [Flavobacteriaceae bacterium]
MNQLRLFGTIVISALFSVGLSAQENPNIILLIGDGMGLSQISAGNYANKNETFFEEFQTIGLLKTHAHNNLVTDSAASGTAMACGVKTLNGAVGISPRNEKLKSILEHCQEANYSTALLATSSIVHATPASFYANVISRKRYQDIALQLSEHDIDIFIGGGKKHFDSRDDRRNLIKEMERYTFVNSLKKFQESTAAKIGYFTYPDEPPMKMRGRKPALDDLFESALQKLDSREKPFFVMVEGSQIDWGGHANDLDYILTEFQEFNQVVGKALAFAKEDGNTIVVVTADHETGGLAIIGGNIRSGRIKGGFNTKGHSATMVPVFAFGPGAKKYSGIQENTAVFEHLVSLLN